MYLAPAIAKREKTTLLFQNGRHFGLLGMTDLGYGILTDIQASGGGERSNYYYSGDVKKFRIQDFSRSSK